MILHDIFEQREPYQKAIDALEQRRIENRIEQLEQYIDNLKKAQAQVKDAEQRQAIQDRIRHYEKERVDLRLGRTVHEIQQPTQRPSPQDPFAYVKPEPRGIGDIQDPRAKMAQLAQKGQKGPLANVGAGIKAFVKGEPEPMSEEQQLGRRGIGMANMKALQDTVEKGFDRAIFQFPMGKYVVGEDDTDKMADYYNALDSAGRTNFVYNVLGDGAKFIQMCKDLGIQALPVEPQQPELPGMPQADPQGQLPLAEKKKSHDADLEAGDIKVARELQKLRAEYPAARSDVEAVARAEIDSTERSQRQLAAIRGANEKQDALLKQLVALDQEQGREIDSLDKENNSLEKQLNQVQQTNMALAKTVSQMTGTKKSARPAAPAPQAQSADNVINLIPDAPADTPKPTADVEPSTQPATSVDTAKKGIQPATGLGKKTTTGQVLKFTPPEQLQKFKQAAESQVKEHGGGIGPRQHWQDLMQEGQPQELINRYLAIDAETDVDAVRKAIQAISRDPALGATSKARLLGQIGMIIKRHRLPIGRAYYQFMQQYMEEGQVKEHITKEPRTARERDDMIDKIRRMAAQERNPANLQIMNKDIEMLKTKYRDLKEQSSTSSDAAERAILNRIMVAHTNLLKQYGPQKVMQAVEEVAYNVGDVDEIGTSDVSGWVKQVEQILGARP